MPVLLLLVFALSGCSSQSEAVESQLNAYSLAASRGADLSPWLTGNALESASQSAGLIQRLGLSAYGVGRFSKTEQVQENYFESCLDVSGIQFRDSSGNLLDLQSPQRQLVEIVLRGVLVSDINLSGVPC